jgi:hypothetical protein
LVVIKPWSLVVSTVTPPARALLDCVPMPKIKVPVTVAAPFAPTAGNLMITPLLSATPLFAASANTGLTDWLATGTSVGEQPELVQL